MSRNVFTEEGRTRLRNFSLRLRSYFIGCAIVGLIIGGTCWWLWMRASFRPLEQMYIRAFVVASVKSWILPAGNYGNYTMLVYQDAGQIVVLNDDMVYLVRDEWGRAVKDQYGHYIFTPYQGVQVPPFGWRQISFRDAEAERLFREGIYRASLLGLFTPIWIVALIVAIIGTAAFGAIDQFINKRYEQGKRLRGSRLIEPKQYERENRKADGLALIVKALTPEQGIRRIIQWFNGKDEPTYTLRMKRSEEAQGALILGDIGSGKSQILHRYLMQVAQRSDEVAVVYDPACEFVKAHYNRQRGDVILNPLDERSPFWSPVFECRRRNKTDFMTLADSFFPGRGDRMTALEKFFNDCARDIFARMLEYHPDPERLILWLSDEKRIDELVEGTEMAHYIDPQGKGQRVGVLAVLSQVGKTLRLLTKHDESKFDFSLSKWAEERRGWIFLTATKDTEERLRPLYAAYLDLLMRRLLSFDDEEGRRRPVKFIIDEVHTLNYLPTLYKAATEGRKFGVHLIQGTQNKAQYDARYGRDATTMLSCPRHSIVLRCKEPESAQWLSWLIGEEEKEKPRTGVTASVSDQGRDSMSYSIQTERRAVVSKEEISALPDLAGYWKYGDAVVPFQFDFWKWRKVVEGFIPRLSKEVELEPEMATAIAADAPPKAARKDAKGNVWEMLREDE